MEEDLASVNVDATLQWGRDVSVADVGEYPKPRQAEPNSFNGAATFPSRMSTVTLPPLPSLLASMGPRRFRRGCWDAWTIDPERSTLQWGRDVSVADVDLHAGGEQRKRVCFNGAATFPSRMLYGKARR